MKLSEAREIIACLPRGRTLFHHCRGRHALLALADLAGEGARVRDLRDSRLAALLQNPVVRAALATSGDGYVHEDVLRNFWQEPIKTWLLSLGIWGAAQRRHDGWYQTSRTGCNLVLQLNLTRDAMAAVAHEFGDADPFNYCLHPICRRSSARYRATFAWARLDVDLDRGEALIEEIQSDWSGWYVWQAAVRSNRALAAVALGWDETMLSATLDFLRRVLGIDRIFYHHFDTLVALRQLDSARPPRSVYTQLPVRFGMRLGEQIPVALQEDRRTRRVLKRISSPRFFLYQRAGPDDGVRAGSTSRQA